MLGIDVRAILHEAVNRGFSIIPVGYEKRPLVSSWKPYQSRLPTRDELLLWWQQDVPAWAVVTGRISKLVVIDFDGDEGTRLMTQMNLQPHVLTPRGAHLYLTHPGWHVPTVNGKSRTSDQGPYRAVDVRADGGYAVFAGASQHGSYRWVREMVPDPPEILPHELRTQIGLLHPPDIYGLNGNGGVSTFQRVPTERLLRDALDLVHGGRGRNEAGFLLAIQLRDNGYSESEAAGIVQEYVASVPAVNPRGQFEPYSDREALNSLHQAYSRPARVPWTLTGNNGNGSHPPRNGNGVSHESSSPKFPVIVVNGRDLRDITTESLAALQQANNPPVLFSRSGRIVTVSRDEQDRSSINELTEAALRGRMTRTADYRRKIADRAGESRLVAVAPPVDAVRDVLALDANSWKFPSLEAVSESPFLRPDGTAVTAPGYDSGTRVFYSSSPSLCVPQVADQPSESEVSAAVRIIDEAIGDFPFDSDASKANAMALLLTPIVRRAIRGQVPIALIDAPQPGVGKSLLAEVFALIHSGLGAAMRPAASSEEEWRKSLFSVLMSGYPLVIFDNLNGRLDSPSLALALTASTFSDRVLGESRIITVAQEATWAITGNNISASTDIVRRSYWIRLDARSSQPWQRTGFRHTDLKRWVRENRGQLIAALLTVARAWYAKGQPEADVPILGSFECWARTVGGILADAGVSGFLRNLDQLHEQSDLSQTQWEAFLSSLSEWREHESFTVADVVHQMEQDSDLRQVLPDEVAPEERPGQLQRRIARAFVQRTGRRYGSKGLFINREGLSRNKVVLWRVRNEED
jgi:hypothetical protein